MESNINPLLDEEVDKPNEKADRRHKGIKLKDIIYYSKRGLSYREIGLILGCTKQSISQRLTNWEKKAIKIDKCLT